MIDVGERTASRVLVESLILCQPLGRWSNYPMTVVRRVARNFPDARRGCSMAFASDLPLAAGMSSSSALMVMTFLLLGEAQRDRPGPDVSGEHTAR